MKKIIRIIACIAILLPMAIGTQAIMSPDPKPTPEPELTRYYFVARDIPGTDDEYYDIKYSVYEIAHDGFCCYNEGPFYPSTGMASTESSEWRISYQTSTYAQVWTKTYSTSSWANKGTINCSTYNTDVISGKITKFTIDMLQLPQE